MRIAVPLEQGSGERRVAITPKVAAELVKGSLEISVQHDGGHKAGFFDKEYEAAGATVVDDPIPGAGAVVLVGPPLPSFLDSFDQGSVVIGLLAPFTDADIVHKLAERKLTAFAFEAMPRTTLAQSMDALSSQATAAGYAAVLAAALESTRFLPMFTTAAGTIPPARVLVLGTGVAGLQAIATARRLGAVVSAYDIRPEAAEQVESLGARFVSAPTEEDASTEGGYAKEVGEDTQKRQLEALAPHVAESDIVIATAQIPGRPAPLLVTGPMVEAMRPGSVVIDVAAPTGGNVEVTVAGETVDCRGTAVMGPLDLPSRVAGDASEMYARNVAELLKLITEDGDLKLDFDHEIVDGACIAHAGEIRNAYSRRVAGMVEL
ncbi:MAG: NAD(P) transhydrogenase subunit alpha [Acidimicrobiia bacterium]|nr:NAD(P) transhydrogenase subunit alpha [Acidimicrobiia bacterium]